MSRSVTRLASLVLLAYCGAACGQALATDGPVGPTVSRSPLDALDPARIPPGEVPPRRPEGLVAVVGSSCGRPEGKVTCVVYSSDRHWIASGCTGGNVCPWDAATLRQVAVLEGCLRVRWLTFSRDGKRLAAAGGKALHFSESNRPWARVWELREGGITPGPRLELVPQKSHLG